MSIVQDLVRFLPSFTPALDWVQVEVTSHCTNPDAFSRRAASCGNADSPQAAPWIDRHMDPRVFDRLAPLISRAGMVHLRGWGEPFLHPVFPELLRRSRELCASVTTATCGEGVTEKQLKNLIALQIDGLTVPMAGMTEETNLARRGTSLDAAVNVIKSLRRLRDEYSSPAPGINLLYTLSRSGLENGELERLPSWAHDLGADGVILTAQSFATRKQDQAEILVPADAKQYTDLTTRLMHAREQAVALALGWYHFVINGGAPGNTCIERPHRTAFIGSDGRVAPCVFSLLPVRKVGLDGETCPAPHYWFQGREFDYPLGTFGSVEHSAFRHIWASPHYRDFRSHFERDELPDHCSWCWRPYMIPA